MFGPTSCSQFLTQLGTLSLVTMEVRWAVTVCMVRSDSFLFVSLATWPGRSQPSFRGNVVVVGPMMAGRGSGKGFPGSSPFVIVFVFRFLRQLFSRLIMLWALVPQLYVCDYYAVR